MNENFESEFIENFAQKIYELRPYGYNDVPPSCETEYVKWKNVSDKERYINLVKEMFNEISLELSKTLPEAEQEIYNGEFKQMVDKNSPELKSIIEKVSEKSKEFLITHMKLVSFIREFKIFRKVWWPTPPDCYANEKVWKILVELSDKEYMVFSINLITKDVTFTPVITLTENLLKFIKKEEIITKVK